MATSNTQSGFVDSWQRGKSVTECSLHMLETEDFTDVTFLVGSEKHVVQAHRYVLASRSCVFHAMFCGRMAEEGEITIPDIDVNVFRDFLRFLYTDKVTINFQNVTGLMYSSRKYDIETLFTQSASFLEKSLSEENLCEILENSHGYGETDFEEKALKMLRKASSTVTKSAPFLDLCSSCFGTFLKSENLNVNEVEVFNAALSWTKKECRKESLTPSHENMRKILGELVYEIRFASLSLQFMVNIVGPSGILSDGERVRIIDRTVNPYIDIRPFKTNVRQSNTTAQPVEGIPITYSDRFPSQSKEICPAGQHAICFSSSHPITLQGCQLYGSDTELPISIDIKLYNDQIQLISHPVQKTNRSLSNAVNDVMFSDAVSIQAHRPFIIIVHISSTTHIVGTGGRARLCQGGVIFFFSNTRGFKSSTSVDRGQIPSLIWNL